MFVTSSNETPEQEEKGHQDKVDHENRQRKRSLLQTFVEVLFYDEGDESDQVPSQTENEKSSQKDPQSEDTKKQMVLELRKLDRERKKSLLMRVVDGLLSRSDNSQQEEMSTESIEDHAALDTANKEYTTGGKCLRQERSNKEVDSVDREIEVDEEEKPPLFPAKCRQRRSGIVMVTNVGELGLPNFGFEHEGREEIEEECTSDTSSLRRQKRSVTFNFSEFPVQPLMNGDGGKYVELNAPVERWPTVTEREKEGDCIESGGNPPASEDKQEVLDLSVSSPIRPAKKRRPKTIRHWLRDPNFYKVCLSFAFVLIKNGNFTFSHNMRNRMIVFLCKNTNNSVYS